MSIGSSIRTFVGRARSFLRNRDANVAMMFGLSVIPLTVAAGAGIDMTRAMIVKSAMTEALDAASLAVGSTPGLTQAQMNTLAQNFFNANYHIDSSYGTPQPVSVTPNGQSVTVSTHVPMPTILMTIVGLNSMDVNSSSTVVWGQTKLWVSFVLDNTGSMTQTDGTGTSKISALKTAVGQVLTMLQNASNNPGDVQAAIIPFSKTVNVGTANVNASWIDWTDWLAAPSGGAPAALLGPGDSCPWSTGSNGFTCQTTPTNGSSTTNTIPSSGTYKGYICPSQVSVYNSATGQGGHDFNGCYTSVATGSTQTVATGSSATCGSHHNCSCTGSGSSKSCKASLYNHVWTTNSTSTWGGCIMDRTQSNDVNNTSPTNAATDFPAENAYSCVPSVLIGLGYNWTTLNAQVNAMTAQGSTNQTIGLDWGWMAQTQGNPLSAPALPANTTQYIILVSDGLNTQDRWSGDGSNEDSGTDARMALACTNAKAAGFIIYAVFVDLNGTQGNSTVLQNCASDANKYFDLQTSGAIITTLNAIGQEITNVRVSH